jgi:hypothetical protein
MHKINFNTQLFILGSVPVVSQEGLPMFLHKELPLHLHQMNTGNSIKNESILLRIFEKGEVELDKPDLDFLEQNINTCRTAPDYMISAAIKQIAEAKSAKPAEEK